MASVTISPSSSSSTSSAHPPRVVISKERCQQAHAVGVAVAGLIQRNILPLRDPSCLATLRNSLTAILREKVAGTAEAANAVHEKMIPGLGIENTLIALATAPFIALL